jgi:hypothetical protein
MAQVQRATSSGGTQYITQVLSEFIFTNDWQTLGWVNEGGTGNNFNASMTVFIPAEIQIISAFLYVDIASRYVTDPLTLTTIVPGYYSPSNIKLYTATDTPKIYLNYPVDSSTSIVTSETGTLSVEFGTWNPVASETMQSKSIDITDKIVVDNNFLVKLTSGVESPTFDELYTNGGIAKMQIVVIGYLK